MSTPKRPTSRGKWPKRWTGRAWAIWNGKRFGTGDCDLPYLWDAPRDKSLLPGERHVKVRVTITPLAAPVRRRKGAA